VRPPRFLSVSLAFLSLAAPIAAGCGSDDGEPGDRSRQAPDASLFPSAKGKSLEQIVSQASEEGPVVSPAGRVLRVGENRFGFALFTVAREQIVDAQVAVYAQSPDGEAKGPFPARIEDLRTEPAFRARTTTDDPDAAQVVYVSELELDRPGEWSFAALIRDGDTLLASLIPTPSLVGQFDQALAAGDRAPRISTPTADDVADISEIDTRVPASSMHDQDFADVVGRKPAVLLFATPALCQSRVCGPVVDVAEQVKRDFGDRVAFIHMEVYNDNDLNKGSRPQFRAFGLETEPWLFVIDRRGMIRTAIEGAFSVGELERAVRQVAA
jgi:hypothetical protein